LVAGFLRLLVKNIMKKILYFFILAIVIIAIGRWIWNSGYESSEIDRMTDKEFNERYGEPRWQEMREY